MKLGRLFVAVALAFSVSTVALGEDKKATDKPADKKTEKKFTEGSCCDKAQKAGKECAHKCCADAAKKDEVCTKCNKPAEKK